MEHNHLTIKTFMAIMAERDAAIRERNMALEERKRAFAERDMAMLQRDAALQERDSAIRERDEAMATLRYKGGSSVNENNMSSDIPNNGVGRGTKSIQQDQQMHIMYDMSSGKYSPGDIMTDSYQINDVPTEHVKARKVKQTEENKELPKKPVKSRRVSRKGAENLKKEISASASDICKIEQDLGADENQGSQIAGWKDSLELNQVNFDDSAMPIPVCSCTGVPQPCYKWGNGGWQSACCTTTMSMYPLPQVSNKRYSRVGGRKMSGGAFSKLLTRLHDEGYDLSSPLDLKDHWAKHGTNRYSTVK
ncbi:hypothetical protein ACET3Z_022594 [Daucus carota]